MVGDNKDDVVISGLAKDEIFPELFDIISGAFLGMLVQHP
jgi:hypothetical protein